MTSEEKFKAIFEVIMGYKPDNYLTITWLKGMFNREKSLLKYPELHDLMIKLQKRDKWESGLTCNSKILMVELIYSQFVKDGLIIDDSQAV